MGRLASTNIVPNHNRRLAQHSAPPARGGASIAVDVTHWLPGAAHSILVLVVAHPGDAEPVFSARPCRSR